MEKGLLVFDLDGTLIDSSADIALATNRTLEACGYGALDVETIKESIGWGVGMLLERLMPEETPGAIGAAREKFLEFYGERLVEDTTLYPGVRETLEYFVERGKKMAVVTNKPQALSERILDEMEMRRFFSMVVGGDTLSNKKPHPEPLVKVIKTMGFTPGESVFVGDSPIDCETGKKAGVFTIGVAYGFRPLDELVSAGFDLLIEKFPELKDVIK
ncbi:MAG TPA: HAD-IA family hydrolase [Thermodesulfobacteriota bacterium]|nr:HAD-IA family hydrolase [Thermodesulfobacteriota bacterium]